VVAEKVHVEGKTSRRASADDPGKDLVDVSGFSVGSHSHHLVLALVHMKTEECGERRVKKTNRVREPQLGLEVDGIARAGSPVSRSKPPGGGGPLPHSVEREDGRVGEGRAVERAGGMGHVMVDEEDLRGGQAEVFLQVGFDPELLIEPVDHGLSKRAPGPWKCCQRTLQYPFKLHKGFLVKNNIVKVCGLDAGLVQTELDGQGRVAFVLLDPAEPFFLRCGYQLPIPKKSRCGIVIVTGYSKNMHGIPT